MKSLTKLRLKFGTRSSPLALIQTQLTYDALTTAWPELSDRIEVVQFETRGDRDLSDTIDAIGGHGVFTDELDEALLAGTIDVAIHSVKDLAIKLRTGTTIAATLEREDPREAFVSQTYANLESVPAGGVFGSASVRRAALLKGLRPDARFELLRGNVGDRVEQLATRGLDGTILAVAGLKRLGLTTHIREILSPEFLMPDPGQGAIGLVTRQKDFNVRHRLAAINHVPTYLAITAERALLADLADHMICGALATVADQTLTLHAVGLRNNGGILMRNQISGPALEAANLGRHLAKTLLGTLGEERIA